MRQVGNQVCDQLASWIARDRPNSITLSSSLAGRTAAREPAREPAHELDSVMEFGLKCTQVQHYMALHTSVRDVGLLNVADVTVAWLSRQGRDFVEPAEHAEQQWIPADR